LSQSTVNKLFPGQAAQEATEKFREMLIANNVSFVRAGRVGETLGVEPISRQGLLPGDLPPVGAAQPRSLKDDLINYAKGFVPEKGKLWQQANPFESLTRPAGVGPRSQFTPIVQGEKAGNTAEDWIRGTHFLGGMLKDMTPAEAKLSTMKYQIDYSDLTQFEKHVMRRVFPWYTFTRHNLPPLLEDMVTNPGKVTPAIRLVGGTREPDQFAPAYIGEGASIPVPGAPEGQQRYISSFGLPIEDEGVKAIGSILRGDTQRSLQTLLGMANPFIKAPIEQATGRQLFSGRRLDELQPSTVGSLGGLLPDEIARGATQVIANSPAGRAAGVVDKLLDPRKTIGETLVNLGSGVQLTDVNVPVQQDIAAREFLKGQLIGTPNIRTREEVYSPVNQRPNLTPEQMYALALLQGADQRVRQRAEQEKLMPR